MTRFRFYGGCILCAAVAGLLLLGASVSTGGTVAIRGHILFPDGEVPFFTSISLAGGNVVKALSADENGNYAIEDLPPGTYTLSVSAAGRRNQLGAFGQKNIVITSDTPLPVVIDITLLTDPAEIRRLGQ